MNTTHRSIMYIGTKPRKDDRPNGILHRVWNGAGSVVEGIPAVQASKLLQHPDEFVDVTGLGPEEIAARAAKAKADAEEKKRRAREPTARQAGGILLEYATEEQILAELERRNLLDALRSAAPADSKPPEDNVDRRDTAAIKEAVEAAIDRILEENAPEKLDERGIPTREAVQEIIGFALTEDEYRYALGDLPPVGADEREIADEE